MKNQNQKPIVSVYMPVFNAAPYLPQAIESVLNQTYSNFEFIIIDDASTDSSWKIIKSYASLDKRIKVRRNSINLGVSLTSNIAISLVRGSFLARIDADDVALSDRLEKQLSYLKSNPSIVAVGGQCVCIDADNKVIGYKKFPIDPQKLKEMFFWAIPLQQPTIMVNLNLLPKNFTWYDRTKSSAEEVNLMFRFLKYGQLANLPNYILFYRQLPGSLSRRNPKNTFFLTLQSRLVAVKKGFQPSFKAVVLNIAQILIISVLPNPAINSLWNIIRGISANDSQYQLGSLASAKV
ncbi:glycosyl transferase family 2 [Candidatus Shapirobacteria bacterium CG06_land_8_20_14_3_00_40_12]|uniref:Glycosyl transferase family 2 n=1 Tax=Candidatus Shapirobacteria bacterium CG06_land_8_20_14_3_00_40_12 TaxID=1974881 RepID=A0A2M7AR83_9BACT|nr:MAG: glycosyl transferase family 2 [Candidatus Shapirobacteria bacterium CG06_land_8_20_14_3_00_40_12]